MVSHLDKTEPESSNDLFKQTRACLRAQGPSFLSKNGKVVHVVCI